MPCSSLTTSDELEKGCCERLSALYTTLAFRRLGIYSYILTTFTTDILIRIVSTELPQSLKSFQTQPRPNKQYSSGLVHARPYLHIILSVVLYNESNILLQTPWSSVMLSCCDDMRLH